MAYERLLRGQTASLLVIGHMIGACVGWGPGSPSGALPPVRPARTGAKFERLELGADGAVVEPRSRSREGSSHGTIEKPERVYLEPGVEPVGTKARHLKGRMRRGRLAALEEVRCEKR